jgi:hypothetical protein
MQRGLSSRPFMHMTSYRFHVLSVIFLCIHLNNLDWPPLHAVCLQVPVVTIAFSSVDFLCMFMLSMASLLLPVLLLFVVSKILHNHWFLDSMAGVLSPWYCLMVVAQLPTSVLIGNLEMKIQWILLTTPVCNLGAEHRPLVKHTHVVFHVMPRQCINSSNLATAGLAVVFSHITDDWLLKLRRPLYVCKF